MSLMVRLKTHFGIILIHLIQFSMLKGVKNTSGSARASGSGMGSESPKAYRMKNSRLDP